MKGVPRAALSLVASHDAVTVNFAFKSLVLWLERGRMEYFCDLFGFNILCSF